MRRMKRNSKNFFLAGILFPFLIYFPSSAPGQVYPEKPITIYCGFEAGATTDLTARTLVNEVSKELGVPVVVENKPGGGSTVAAGLLASKKPEGYTLGIISTTALVTTPILMKMSYDPFKDFTYILSYGDIAAPSASAKNPPLTTCGTFWSTPARIQRSSLMGLPSWHPLIWPRNFWLNRPMLNSSWFLLKEALRPRPPFWGGMWTLRQPPGFIGNT